MTALLPLPVRSAAAIWMASLFTVALGQELTLGVIAGTNLTDDVQSGRQTFPGGILPSGQTQTSTFIVDPGARRPIIGIQLEHNAPQNLDQRIS